MILIQKKKKKKFPGLQFFFSLSFLLAGGVVVVYLWKKGLVEREREREFSKRLMGGDGVGRGGGKR